MDFVSVARRVERKLALMTKQLAHPTTGTEPSTLAIGGGLAVYSGPGGYMNRACAIGLDGPVTQEQVQELVRFFESRGEEARIELCPFVDGSLLQELARAGFVLSQFGNVLARRLSSVTLERPEIDGVTIEPLDKRNAATVRAYVEVIEQGFAPPGEPVLPITVELVTKTVLLPTTDSYFARTKDGTIVGVASSSSSEGVTAFTGATVLPAWRKRGIQRALMSARLASAIRHGSDLAYVITAPGIATERNSVRLGFSMAYSRVVLRRPREGLKQG